MSDLRDGVTIERVTVNGVPYVRVAQRGQELCRVTMPEWIAAVAATSARGELAAYYDVQEALEGPFLPEPDWRG